MLGLGYKRGKLQLSERSRHVITNLPVGAQVNRRKLVAAWVSDKSATGRPSGTAAAELQAKLTEQYTATAEVRP